MSVVTYFRRRMSIRAEKAGDGSNERRLAIFAIEWWDLIVISEIARSAGARGDPWGSRRFRVAFGFGTWSRAVGGSEKRRAAATYNPNY